MRIAIFSDIHGNFDALEAILLDAAPLAVDRWVCLGDLVGYHAQPQECVDAVRELDCLCVQGNHDGVAGGREEPTDFNDVAAQSIYWTRDHLRAETREWLADLPRQATISADIRAVHGSLRDRDEYLLSATAVRANFQYMEQLGAPTTVFFGHTHRRAAFIASEGRIYTVDEPSLVLQNGQRYLLNPGGAGQPRDGVPGAPYVILEDRVVHFRRAAYDVEAAAQKTLALPFGDFLADRLRRGA
jgi:predicted phosphodiesterase